MYVIIDPYVVDNRITLWIYSVEVLSYEKKRVLFESEILKQKLCINMYIIQYYQIRGHFIDKSNLFFF